MDPYDLQLVFPLAVLMIVPAARAIMIIVHPERLTISQTLPKALQLPNQVWINQPEQPTETPAA